MFRVALCLIRYLNNPKYCTHTQYFCAVCWLSENQRKIANAGNFQWLERKHSKLNVNTVPSAKLESNIYYNRLCLAILFDNNVKVNILMC